MPEKFAGFPGAGLKFLRELKENNDRDWFREKKATYDEQVHQPMALLVSEVAAQCRKRGLMIAARDRSPVMRVYRDIRFSPDKRPFKTHVGAGLKPAAAQQGEVYMHVSPEESFVAAGFWMPERPFLQVWRTAMAAKPADFLRVVKGLTKHRLSLSTENQLTRLPRGYDQHAESEIAEWLKLTSFITVRDLKASEYKSAGLVDLVSDFAMAAKPLLEYGWKLNYAPKKDLLEERFA